MKSLRLPSCRFVPVFAAALLACAALPVVAQADCRPDGDFAACRAAPDGADARYILWSQEPRWSGATMRWSYNPAGAPSWIDSDAMLALVQAAMAKWSAVCKIGFEYQGSTATAPTQNDGVNVIGWSYADGYAGYTKYWWSGANRYFSDVDIRLDPAVVADATQLPGLLNHELGHAVGLAHSDVASGIMFANPYHSYTYQETIRQDDIDGCVALYGAPAATPTTTPADCLFNWAEQTFPQYFSPAGAASNTYEQYYFRYYSGTGNYLATAADGVWVLGRSFGGAPLQVGALSAYLGQAGCSP